MEGEERKPLIKSLKYISAAKIIASSGYSNDQIMSEYEKFGFSDVTTKLYDIDTMEKTSTKAHVARLTLRMQETWLSVD